MSSSDFGIMIISIIGLFGFASFVFEYLSSNHSTKINKQRRPIEKRQREDLPKKKAHY